MSTLLLPNNEQVVASWLAGVTGLTTAIGSTLPADTSSWATKGFVQYTLVGGTPDKDIPMRRPVVRIDSWAANTNSNKPPWNRASQALEIIRVDTLLTRAERAITMPTTYEPARVLSAYFISEPRRILDDQAGFARIQVDLQMHWTVVP
jgi:hypothetical protein